MVYLEDVEVVAGVEEEHIDLEGLVVNAEQDAKWCHPA
jgi:hypothetical protein